MGLFSTRLPWGFLSINVVRCTTAINIRTIKSPRKNRETARDTGFLASPMGPKYLHSRIQGFL